MNPAGVTLLYYSLFLKGLGSLAQLNRAFDYGSKGCRFESCRSHKKKQFAFIRQTAFFVCVSKRNYSQTNIVQLRFCPILASVLPPISLRYFKIISCWSRTAKSTEGCNCLIISDRLLKNMQKRCFLLCKSYAFMV